MINFENNIAEKYEFELAATRAFVEHLRCVEIDKNLHNVEKGGFNDNFYIIKKGILRAYMPSEESEQTLWFGILGIVLLGLCIPLQESLPLTKRFSGKLKASFKGYKKVTEIKGFTSYSIIYALAMAALFAYISATPFIVQDLFGFSELQFSLVFAVNAVALATGSALSLRFSEMNKAVFYGSVIGSLLAAIGAMTAFFDMSIFIVYEIPTFIMLLGIGLVLTGSTSQAMNLGREYAGTASAVVGGIGYIAGGLVSPLVSYGNICLTSFLWCVCFLLMGGLILLFNNPPRNKQTSLQH